MKNIIKKPINLKKDLEGDKKIKPVKENIKKFNLQEHFELKKLTEKMQKEQRKQRLLQKIKSLL